MDLQLVLKKEKPWQTSVEIKKAKTGRNCELVLSNLDQETFPFSQEHPTDGLYVNGSHPQTAEAIYTNKGAIKRKIPSQLTQKSATLSKPADPTQTKHKDKMAKRYKQ